MTNDILCIILSLLQEDWMKIADSGRFTLFASKEGCVIGAAPIEKEKVRKPRKKRFESSPLAKQVVSSEQSDQTEQQRNIQYGHHDFRTFDYPAEVPDLDENSASPYSAKYASMKADPNNPLRLDLGNKSSSTRSNRIPVNTTFGFYVAAVLLEPITLSEWERIVRSSETWEEAAVFASKKYRGFPIMALGLDFQALRGFENSPLSTDEN